MIKNRLGNKRACIIGTNQLRLRPGAYGNPEYEPGGEAIKFFSDVRVKTKTIAVPNGTGHVEEEPCWDGDGIDRYRYVNLSVPKNKVFSPFRQSTIRFWFEEKGSPGRGIDPVFDCFQYLEETGQVSGKGRYAITLEGLWTDRQWTWKEFKKFILNPNRLESYAEFGFSDPEIDTLAKEFKGCGGVNPYVVYEDKNVNKLAKELRKLLDTKLDIHAACRAQISDSSAFKMYFNTAGKVKKVVVSDASKTCSACVHWKVDKSCKKMKAEDSCKEWEAPPPPEVKKEKKAKVEAEAEIPIGKKKKSMTLEV
jgi:RecA/RadA recombinase